MVSAELSAAEIEIEHKVPGGVGWAECGPKRD